MAKKGDKKDAFVVLFYKNRKKLAWNAKKT
jgi:hypothetical protein